VVATLDKAHAKAVVSLRRDFGQRLNARMHPRRSAAQRHEESRVNPSVTNVVLFAVYTVCTSAGLLLFKWSWPGVRAAFQRGDWAGPASIAAAGGVALYVTSFLLWLVIVSRMPLTVAYPLAIGLSLLLVSAGAIWWLGETLTVAHGAGAALILVGVVLLTR
jgi:drug/metabolite transporter (DMT)-like permease